MAKKTSIIKQKKAAFPKPRDILRMSRLWVGIAGFIFCVVVIYISDFTNIGLPHRFIVERALVHSVVDSALHPDHYLQTIYLGSQVAEIEVLTGQFAGQRLQIIHTLTRFSNLRLQDGMEALISIVPGAEYLEAQNISIYGPSRAPVLIGSIVIIIVGMLIMGRMKGFYAAYTLIFTLIMVVYFMIAAIIRGESPVVFALLTAIITTSFTLCMVAGISRQSLAAIGGTWSGLAAAGLFSVVLGRLANVSGMHLDHSWQMVYQSPPGVFIRIPELFFAAIIVAASGAVVDAAMSISSAVFEIKEQSPGITTKRLYGSGMRIGGDILGANSDTLILAFVGASLPTLILISMFGFPFLRIINSDMVAVEIIQGVSATMGMLIGIPATALFSAILATRNDKKV
ncbi:MAG: YibE/F family protein [Defluviitaleaceae bacterium]|nr:YibE/F family protein [Defluviitaleaceae bacterium]